MSAEKQLNAQEDISIEEVSNEIISKYKILNEKCDEVLKKIKKRKNKLGTHVK